MNTPLPWSRSDSRPAFERLAEDHAAALQRLALRFAGNREDAQDLLQETLLDAFRSFHRFEPGTHFYNWVARIMRNNQLDRSRRRRLLTLSLDQPSGRDDAPAPEPVDELADPMHLLLDRAMAEEYEDALGRLGPEQRRTVLLCDVAGATYEDAAAMSRCPVGTIRSRLHRAHRVLQDVLGHLNPARARDPRPAEVRSSRRAFLRMGTAAAGAALAAGAPVPGQAAGCELTVVWALSEPRPGAYRDGLAGALAASLGETPGKVETFAGMGDGPRLREALARARTLVIWRGEGDPEPDADTVELVRRRVRWDGMGLVVLHAAADTELLRAVLGEDHRWRRRRLAVRPCPLRVAAPRHPVVAGLPPSFSVQQREVVDESGLPQPGVVLLDAPSSGTQPSWQAVVWSAGEGRLAYLEAADGSLPTYRDPLVAELLRSAHRWAGRASAGAESPAP